MIEQFEISIKTSGKGLCLISDQVLSSIEASLPEKGLLNIFLKHTSASLLIQENADPTAKQDLEEFFDRLAPENQSWHRHTLEGPDDTTSHLKSALTQCELTLPIQNSKLALGVWQGIYLFEHRHQVHNRNLLLTLYS